MKRQLSERAQMEPPQRGPDPGDQVLIDTLIANGMDRREAGAWRDHLVQGSYGQRLLRYTALCFYWDTKAVARGDAAARDRVDFVRHAWNERARGEASRLEAQQEADLEASRA